MGKKKYNETNNYYLKIGLLLLGIGLEWIVITSIGKKCSEKTRKLQEKVYVIEGIPKNVNLNSKEGAFGGYFYLSGTLEDEYGDPKSFSFSESCYSSSQDITKAYSAIKNEVEDGDSEKIKFTKSYNKKYNCWKKTLSVNGEEIKF